jgi:hypothetical protein
MQPRLTLNSLSFLPSFLNAGIIGIHHHARFRTLLIIATSHCVVSVLSNAMFFFFFWIYLLWQINLWF